MRLFTWYLSAFGALLGSLLFMIGFSVAQTSPEYTASAALGLVCAGIPYALATACDRIAELKRATAGVKLATTPVAVEAR